MNTVPTYPHISPTPAQMDAVIQAFLEDLHNRGHRTGLEGGNTFTLCQLQAFMAQDGENPYDLSPNDVWRYFLSLPLDGLHILPAGDAQSA